MYKKILCAIEASDEGKIIISKAVELADLYGAEVFMISVISYTLLPKDYQKEMKDKVRPKLESIAQKYKIPKKNISIKFGKPYQEICSLADKKNIDLIVLGTHSKKGMNAFIGSTANAVTSHAGCDVTLIKV